LSLIAYATTIFEYFPRGINAKQLEREIESNHQPSHLSKPTALQFLDNIRKCISETIEFLQDTTLLEGEVVVDETLWSHEELEGG
jgi:DNA primase large subunit